MAKINYKPEGFLKNAKYLFYFKEFFNDYEDKFGEAESVEVLLKESYFSNPVNNREEPIVIPEDCKHIVIKYITRFDPNRRATSNPEPKTVFDELRFLMDRAVLEYSEKCKKQ